MSRLYANFAKGTTTAILNPGDTTLQSAELPTTLPTVTAPDELWLILDPDGAQPEIVAVTDYDGVGTSATIARNQDGTGAVTHSSGTTWRADVTKGGLEGLGDGSLIDDAAILNRHLAVDSVGQAQLQNNVVGPNELAPGAVGQSNIQNDAILNDMIVDGTIEQSKLASGSGVPADSVTTVEVVDGSLLGTDLQPGTIGATEIASGPGQISNVHISDTAQIAYGKLDLTGSVQNADLATDSVRANQIQANAVGNGEINNAGEFDMSEITLDKGTGTLRIDGNTIEQTAGPSVNLSLETVSGDIRLVPASQTIQFHGSVPVWKDLETDGGGVGARLISLGGGDWKQVAGTSRLDTKENIEPFTDTDDLLRLTPVEFDYKDWPREGLPEDHWDRNTYIGMTHTCLGFVAEHVAEVNPRFAYYDDEGDPMQINYEAITAALVAKVQELEARL